jgi:hypothetical protein
MFEHLWRQSVLRNVLKQVDVSLLLLLLLLSCCCVAVERGPASALNLGRAITSFESLHMIAESTPPITLKVANAREACCKAKLVLGAQAAQLSVMTGDTSLRTGQTSTNSPTLSMYSHRDC